MLDCDPLSALNQLTRPDEKDVADGAFVAKLRYQRTKIEQAPDTILVDAEVVAIIRAQQQWADTHLGPRWARTDRILPNGLCLLPPRQACAKGNACLTCDKCATDATFLPDLTAQQQRIVQLIDERQKAFTARTGQPMGEGNVWL